MNPATVNEAPTVLRERVRSSIWSLINAEEAQ